MNREAKAGTESDERLGPLEWSFDAQGQQTCLSAHEQQAVRIAVWDSAGLMTDGGV